MRAYFMVSKTVHKIYTYSTTAKYVHIYLNNISAYFMFVKILHFYEKSVSKAQNLSTIWKCLLYSVPIVQLHRCGE